jgi:hypothetical protein
MDEDHGVGQDPLRVVVVVKKKKKKKKKVKSTSYEALLVSVNSESRLGPVL